MSKRCKNMALDLYTKDGWINIPAVSSIQAWCYIIIGKRQVGKTYGVLKHELESKIHFLYLRRTTVEFDAITSDPELNPFLPLQRKDLTQILQKPAK